MSEPLLWLITSNVTVGKHSDKEGRDWGNHLQTPKFSRGSSSSFAAPYIAGLRQR